MSHVVPSDPTSAQGHEERGRTERTGMDGSGGGGIARVVEQMAGNGGNGEVGDKKRTDERDGQGKQSCEKHQYKKNE